MRLLVLGGTRFLSRAVAAEAVARGHEVTCACRGRSGPLPDGVTHLPWDRAEEPPAALVGGRWDAVVDVARLPSQVRRAVAAAPDAHWVFVSTISVYADDSRPGTPATLPVLEPLDTDVDLTTDPEAYGPMKVACEQAVLAGAASATVVRPGLIVGPGDPSGRFTYWPARLARAATDGREVLAPGSPDDVVQVIDVRDLATWLVDLAGTRPPDVLDGVGDLLPLGALLAEAAAGVGARPRLTWVDADFLASRGVEPWSGPRSVPLWLPRPAFDGMMGHDPAPSVAAGLRVRPVAETARDTLAWLRETPDAVVTGLTADEEAEVLVDWRASRR
jgi:nucleoside-diphosphate-sugar epimerase